MISLNAADQYDGLTMTHSALACKMVKYRGVASCKTAHPQGEAEEGERKGRGRGGEKRRGGKSGGGGRRREKKKGGSRGCEGRKKEEDMEGCGRKFLRVETSPDTGLI